MTAVMSTTFAGRPARRPTVVSAAQETSVSAVSVSGASVSAASVPASTRLRITRRGRVVLTVLVAAPLIVLAALFGPGALGAVAGTQSSDARFDHVTVAAGQSLWQIAEHVAPGDDPRDVVSAIMDLNGLTSSVVVPGERLAIPQQYTTGH